MIRLGAAYGGLFGTVPAFPLDRTRDASPSGPVMNQRAFAGEQP